MTLMTFEEQRAEGNDFEDGNQKKPREESRKFFSDQKEVGRRRNSWTAGGNNVIYGACSAHLSLRKRKRGNWEVQR